MDKTIRYTNIFLYLLLGVSAVLGVLFYTGGIESEAAVYEEPIWTEQFLLWAYILFGVAAVFALGFPLIKSILNPKNLKKAIIPIVAFAAFFFIAYNLASAETFEIIGEETPSADIFKYAGTMIHMVYLLAGGAFLAIIFSEIAGAFK